MTSLLRVRIRSTLSRMRDGALIASEAISSSGSFA